MKTVLAFGTFDVLHPGHIHYLKKAKKLGDKLIVIVSRDDSIRMIKKREPIMNEQARLRIIASLEMVDKAVLGNRLAKKSDIYNILKKYKPNIIALGYDQRADIKTMKKVLSKRKIKAKIVRLRTKLNDDLYKSSKLISLLAEEK